VKYETPTALRMALEDRFRSQAKESAIPIDRLRRRVMFERIIARLEYSEPGLWVLKGGMALEVRLQDDARLTKDIDLGFRDEVANGEALHERLIDVLRIDPHDDWFVLHAGAPAQLGEDGGGHLTWRFAVSASLADRPFGMIQLDVSPRTHELSATDRIVVQNSLEFAGVRRWHLQASTEGEGHNWKVRIRTRTDRTAVIHCFFYAVDGGLVIGVNPGNARALLGPPPSWQPCPEYLVELTEA
jgi:Nucleotidyl transferase AbiEii toxin, Type IV TA system